MFPNTLITICGGVMPLLSLTESKKAEQEKEQGDFYCTTLRRRQVFFLKEKINIKCSLLLLLEMEIKPKTCGCNWHDIAPF